MNKCWFNPDVGSAQYCFEFQQTAEDHHKKGLSLAPIGSTKHDGVYFIPILRNGEYARNGIMINYCPFCGTRLSTLVAREQRAQRVR